MTRKIRNYTPEFKHQLVSIYQAGKTLSELSVEYGVAKSTIYGWIKYFENSGSFKKQDNLSDNEKELIKLKKENKQLKMENDLLKQAALILGRK